MTENKEHVCLKTIREKWTFPFNRQITFNLETGDLSSDWAIMVFDKTGSGAISKRNKAWLFFDYCPICGEKITEDDIDLTGENDRKQT